MPTFAGTPRLPWASASLALLAACEAPKEVPSCGPGTVLENNACVSAHPRPRLLIDDFEDGDDVPSAAELAPWQCYSFNPGVQPVKCGITSPGADSNFAQYLTFGLTDPPDGAPNGTGAALRSVVSAGTIDLRPYEKLGLKVALVPGIPPPLPTAVLEVSFSCTETMGSFALDASAGPAWKVLVLPLTAVPAACASVVDGLDLQLLLNLADGQSATADLWVDDLYLE